jgi:cytochrome c553
MYMNRRGTCFLILMSFLVKANALIADESVEKLSSEQVQFFESKIRPVLVEQCYRCHSADGQGIRGGLAVDSKDALLAGGESGPAVVPGELSESILWNAINYEDYRMPPKGKLPDSVLSDFRRWIEMGAPDPRVASGVMVHSRVTDEDIEKSKTFWSFQKPTVRSPTPATGHSSLDWAKTEIDQYVESMWTTKELTPNQDADAYTLLRRIYYDLLGMPPSPQDIDRFVAEAKKDLESAIAKVVDDLLAREQFGERWGRYWLDVARYAETTGKEVDITFPNAWRYRDYVIDSFNQDKPYNQFLREQIAGDLIPVKSDSEWATNLIATGFLAIGPKSLAEQNPRQFQADLIDEQIDTTTRVVLGLSVACARCHDHKFDPIPQSDYYALAGIFQSTQSYYGGNRSLRNRQPSNLIVLPIADKQSAVKPISKNELLELKEQLKDAEEKFVEARRAQRTQAAGKTTTPRTGFASVAVLDQVVAQLNNRINSYDDRGNPIAMCMGVQDASRTKNARILVRGEIDNPAQEVERGLVRVLGGDSVGLPKDKSGRLELANWLASNDNPLTARVMVNRIWQHLIGHAIVREPDNFGFSGPKPSHPELLDYLAVQYMRNGWSTKNLIKEIVTSRVYRMSSQFKVEQHESDPDNAWLARANVRRLDAEAIRDSMLANSGQLDLKRPYASVIASFGQVGMGPNGPVALPSAALGMLTGNKPPALGLRNLLGNARSNSNPLEATNYHRSVYLPIARNAVPRVLDVFDFAEPSLVVVERETSNTPSQALYMLNSEFVLEQSDALARKLIKSGSNTPDRLATAFKIVYGRSATNDEMRVAGDFVRKASSVRGSSDSSEHMFRALSQFCQALFCSAEYRFLN